MGFRKNLLVLTNKQYQNLGKTPRTLCIEILDDFDGAVLQTLPADSRVPVGRLSRVVKTKVLTYEELQGTLGSGMF